MKLTNYILAFLVLGMVFYSCGSDDNPDGPQVVPIRDRAEQYAEDLESIESYLATHFYNYEEFNADPNTTDFEIVFDTIEGDNSTRTPLSDQVEFKMVTDDEGVEYRLYYLKVREGLGDQVKYTDSTFMSYNGSLLNDVSFDGAPNPIWFDLLSTIQGFRQIAEEFRASDGDPIDNGDGTFTFQNFGIGAMFIPSGLAYFAAPPTAAIPVYSPLRFTFSMFRANDTDHDRDNVPTFFEDTEPDSNLAIDRDGDGDPTNDFGDLSVFNDDTDSDNIPNFFDIDDDGDGVLTINEDLEPDSDLTVDRDGDGDPTNDLGDGNPMNDDTDGDGIPNYLDPDDSESNDPDSNN